MQRDTGKRRVLSQDDNQIQSEQDTAEMIVPESGEPAAPAQESSQAASSQDDAPETTVDEEKTVRISSNAAREAAGRIAAALGEREKTPLWQIKKMIKLRGVEFAEELVNRAMEVEANGGMMTADGERRRTLGGVYFQLARELLPEDERDQIFNKWRHSIRRRLRDEAQYKPFEFDERTDILSTILAEAAGEISEMKVTMTGRPGPIERRQELVITTMQYVHPGGFSMPRGVPDFPASELTYVVYIAIKHWEQVEKQITKDERDELVVDGLCAFDPELEQFAVYATHVTTKKRQKQDRRVQKDQEQAAQAKDKASKEKTAKEKSAKDKMAKDKAAKEQAAKKQRRDLLTEPTMPVAAPELTLPEGVPPEVASKLTDLMRAADTYRRKVAALEAKPPNQQHGLDMTRRLLEGIESKIEALKREHGIKV